MTTCRRRLARFLRGFVLAAIAIGDPAPLRADTTAPAPRLTEDTRLQLETALTAYVRDRTKNGRFVYFNPVRSQIEGYSAITHPVRITPLAEGRYVLCSRFRGADGQAVEIEFLALVDQRGSRVIQTLVDQHGAILRLIRSRDYHLN